MVKAIYNHEKAEEEEEEEEAEECAETCSNHMPQFPTKHSASPSAAFRPICPPASLGRSTVAKAACGSLADSISISKAAGALSIEAL